MIYTLSCVLFASLSCLCVCVCVCSSAPPSVKQTLKPAAESAEDINVTL